MFNLWGQYLPSLLRGTWVSIELVVCSLVLAVVLGFLLTAMRMSKNPVFYGIVTVPFELVRSTPVIIELFIVYYGFGAWGLSMPAFLAGVLTLGVFYSTLYAEIFRSGVEAVDKGQWEAAHALGLSRRVAMWKIVVPQSLVTILPPAMNTLVELIKDTALVVTISVAELMYQAYTAGAATFKYMDMFILAGIIYFVICYGLSLLVGRWEHRAGRGRA